MDYNVLAFIGRFQPFHNGHMAVVDEALSRANKVALVLGSHDQPRSTRNPFTTADRIEMITAVYPRQVAEGRIQFVPQVDHTYNLERWIAGVQTGVAMVANRPFTPDPIKIGLIGHSKDQSSFYLKSFPTWGSVSVPNMGGIDATTIRRDFFNGTLTDHDGALLPDDVADWLNDFRNKATYAEVRDETAFIAKYKEQWACAPYPPTFQTVDAVVTQSGHILLIERGAMPGKGLWALPGGFLDPNETLRDGMLRELREETKIAVPEAVLRGSVRGWRTFDDPHRSQRGRTITTAFHVELRGSDALPKIKGSDDAAKAKWVPMSNLSRGAMFEDHFDIIQSMVGL